MADSNEGQFKPARHRNLSRGKVALLVGLALVIAAGSVALFSPIVPEIIAAFNAHPTSTATTAGDAPMFGFNAGHTRYNTHENLLTFATVSHLVTDWTSPATGGSIFSSPVAANGVIYVGSLDSRLYAFNAAGCGQPSCPPLWTSTPTGNMLLSSPAAAGGVVYIGSYDALTGIGKLYAFKAGGCGNPTCSPLWSASPPQSGFYSSPAVSGGVVYVGGSDDGILYAYNAAGCDQSSCSPLWTSTPTGAGSAIESSPAVAGGVVYIGSWDHRLYAFNASGCGHPPCPPLWSSIPTGSIIESSPAVAGGVVYIGSDDGSLYAFDATGCGNPPCSPLWTSPFNGDAIFSSPLVTDGVVYVGSLDHKLYAFHLPGRKA